jgi:hypothetical protein
MDQPAALERRRGYDRRKWPRVTRCERCLAYLTVDRRGNTVRLHSGARYVPAAARDTEPGSSPKDKPRCPVCGADLRPAPATVD